jgi:hypothetical protein
MGELITLADLEVARRELGSSIAAIGRDLVATTQQLEAALDNLRLRLTIRLGGMLAIAIAALATIIKL